MMFTRAPSGANTQRALIRLILSDSTLPYHAC